MLPIFMLALCIALQLACLSLGVYLLHGSFWRRVWLFIDVLLVIIGLRRSVLLALAIYRGSLAESVLIEETLVLTVLTLILMVGSILLYVMFRSIEEKERFLQESEKKYRTLFEYSQDALTLGEPYSGRCLAANSTALKMFDVESESEFLQYAVWDLSPERQPDGRMSKEKIQEMAAKALQEGSCLFEWTHRRRTGGAFIASVLLARVIVEEKPLLQATIRDITEQKQAEKALRESEEKYHALFDGAYDALMILDAPSGRLLSANPSALKMFGIEGEEELSARWPQLFSPHDQPGGRASKELARETIDAAMRDGAAAFEWLHRRRNGDEFFASVLLTRIVVKGTPVLQATVRDITRQKLSEEALRESEARFKQLAALSRTITWEVDASGLCTFISPEVETVLGYSPEEIVGQKHCYDLAPQSDSSETRARNLELLARRESFLNMENAMCAKDGRIVWLSSNGAPVFDAHGAFVGYRGMDRDITEHKRMQEEKEHLQEQFVQTQKMECVGRLAGGVAHDFNNKLSIILGYLELVQAQVGPDAPLRPWLDKIDQAARSSVNLTRQILAFARKQTIAPQRVNLNDAVEGMLDMLRKLIGEDIELEWRPGESLGEITIDLVQIDQALANLLLNGRDAISGNGKITVETSNCYCDEAYCRQHVEAVEGDYVMLAVSDTGCGMSREIQESLFEPFFTTKPLGQGTGLGLPTVYGIVKQNEGFINVYSEPGRGSIFKIYLPRCVDAARPTTPAPEAGPTSGGQETILIVEDEEDLLALCQVMLEGLGYSVLVAGTPREALHHANASEGQIDLLITDVIMPEMNGRELAEQIAARFPQIRRLFMSGYTANVIAHRGILDADVHFIEKPFSTETLAARVRAALTGR